MNCTIWNAQGAGGSGFRRACRYLLNKFKTDVLVLMETRVSGAQAQDVCTSLGFSDNFRVEAVGFSGGIWILWNSTITTVQIVKGYPHFIHSKIDSNGDWFHLIVVYAPPTPTRRRQFWTDLEEVVATIHEPLFVGGDFNCILSIEERLGGSGGLSPDSNVFADMVGRQDLIDMGYAGSQFTWFRGNRENPGVAKRLDRIFSNVCGRLKWDRAMVRHLPTTKSDHNPLYLMLDPVTSADQNRRPFRFEATWFTHPNFMSLISDVWKGDSDTQLALSSLREDLRKWNREVFGNIHRRKDKILARLQGIENALSSGDVARLADLRTTLKKDLDDVLIQEEIMWRQKSRVDWLACGDRNTTFFHTSTIVRRRRKSVVALRDTNANWIVDKVGLENMVVDYFVDLYQEPVANDPLLRLPRGGFSSISHADLLSLMAPFSDDEIWLTVKQMGALKALGIDGFQPVFYHKCWSTIGPSVCAFGRTLSLAGRVTLARSVLSAIPSYAMSSTRIPNSMCDKLDRVCRSFIWGGYSEVRKLHLVAWEDMCLPKRLGGLGIRSMKDANMAMIGKLGWRLLTGTAGLWGQLMTAKYGLSMINGRVCKSRRTHGSYTWRSILWAIKGVVERGTRWNIGDGKSVRFWKDCWAEAEPLMNFCTTTIASPLVDCKVSDLWSPDSGWNWEVLGTLLAPTYLMCIASLAVGLIHGVGDSLRWAFTTHGDYSTKSAYCLLRPAVTVHDQIGRLYSQIWKIAVTERVRLFLWLGVRGRLLTNCERARRHLTSVATCGCCGLEDETLIHLFRDCSTAKEVWALFLVNADEQFESFFAAEPLNWLDHGLHGRVDLDLGTPNEILFGVILWWLWKWRCNRVFDRSTPTAGVKEFLIQQAREFAAHCNRRKGENEGRKVETAIGWSKPAQGWVSICTDGAKRNIDGGATAGGSFVMLLATGLEVL
ncbi:hypothetical protein V2J09_007099 [Rumex salicifolius]